MCLRISKMPYRPSPSEERDGAHGEAGDGRAEAALRAQRRHDVERRQDDELVAGRERDARQHLERLDAEHRERHAGDHGHVARHVAPARLEPLVGRCSSARAICRVERLDNGCTSPRETRLSAAQNPSPPGVVSRPRPRPPPPPPPPPPDHHRLHRRRHPLPAARAPHRSTRPPDAVPPACRDPLRRRAHPRRARPATRGSRPRRAAPS